MIMFKNYNIEKHIHKRTDKKLFVPYLKALKYIVKIIKRNSKFGNITKHF